MNFNKNGKRKQDSRKRKQAENGMKTGYIEFDLMIYRNGIDEKSCQVLSLDKLLSWHRVRILYKNA